MESTDVRNYFVEETLLRGDFEPTPILGPTVASPGMQTKKRNTTLCSSCMRATGPMTISQSVWRYPTLTVVNDAMVCQIVSSCTRSQQSTHGQLHFLNIWKWMTVFNFQQWYWVWSLRHIQWSNIDEWARVVRAHKSPPAPDPIDGEPKNNWVIDSATARYFMGRHHTERTSLFIHVCVYCL